MIEIRPISLKEANRFIIENHRHHDKVQGHKFSEGAYINGELVGVACVGRPVARCLDDGLTLEVTRLCTDGSRNLCSILYGRCARIAKEMGYKRIITYILESEPGVSLRASGWQFDGAAGGGDWTCKSRPRESTEITLFGESRKYPAERKQRWIKTL